MALLHFKDYIKHSGEYVGVDYIELSVSIIEDVCDWMKKTTKSLSHIIGKYRFVVSHSEKISRRCKSINPKRQSKRMEKCIL